MGECASERCRECGMQFSKLNLVVNLALAVIKGFIGSVARSRALMVSAVYSVNDVLSAIVVMVSLRVGRAPADEDHPYGHGMAEFIAIGVVSVVLLFAILFILVYSVVDVLRGVDQPPHIIALMVALVTMGTNEFLARRGFCAAARTGSPALYTAAEHNRADAISSLATVVGVGGAALGLHILDPLVAIFEAVHIVWLGGILLGHSIRGLMDAALSDEDLRAVSRVCASVPGVASVGEIRSRQAGPLCWIDVEVRVTGTVGDARQVADQVRQAVRRAVRRTVRTQIKLTAAGAAARLPDGELAVHG